MTQITITSLTFNGHPIDIPPGLSELLENCWVPGPRETKYLHKYDLEVIREDGRFVTMLTRKKKS